MKKIIIVSEWSKEYPAWRIIDLANEKLKEHGYQIVLRKIPEREAFLKLKKKLKKCK